MKVKGEFVLRQIGKIWTVMPFGQTTMDLNGILTLNETGVILWEVLARGGSREEMVRALTAEYDVSCEQAGADVERFIGILAGADLLEM